MNITDLNPQKTMWKYYLISGMVALVILLGAVIAVLFVKYGQVTDTLKRQETTISEKNAVIGSMAEDDKRQRSLQASVDELKDKQDKTQRDVQAQLKQLRADNEEIRKLLDTPIPDSLGQLYEKYYRDERPELPSAEVSIPAKSKAH